MKSTALTHNNIFHQIAQFLTGNLDRSDLAQDNNANEGIRVKKTMARSYSFSNFELSSTDLIIPAKVCQTMPARSEDILTLKRPASDQMNMILSACELTPTDLEDNGINILYEERPLCHLIGLNEPTIVVTSKPVPPSVIGYYLGLQGTSGEHLKKLIDQTCVLHAAEDGKGNLCLNVMGNQKLLAVLFDLTQDKSVNIICHSGSENMDHFVSLKEGFTHTECTSELLHLGTKTGNRSIFNKSGVKFPAGVPNDVRDVDLTNNGFIMTELMLAKAIARELEEEQFIQSWIVKHNEGVAGRGNAELTLVNATSELKSEPLVEAILLDLHNNLVPFDKTIDAETFLAKIPIGGVIAEQNIVDKTDASPSFQGRIEADGTAKIVCNHEQLLDGHTYKGCMFPAEDSYRDTMNTEGMKVGQALASIVPEAHFGVDFIETPNELYAIEINLRKTGTTYPFMTVINATQGVLSPKGDKILTKKGNALEYISTDYIMMDCLKTINVDDFIYSIKKKPSHWNPETEHGAIIHLFGLLPKGRIGATLVAPTKAQAKTLLEDLKKDITEIAEFYEKRNTLQVMKA